jgi:hypothetical protein
MLAMPNGNVTAGIIDVIVEFWWLRFWLQSFVKRMEAIKIIVGEEHRLLITL